MGAGAAAKTNNTAEAAAAAAAAATGPSAPASVAGTAAARVVPYLGQCLFIVRTAAEGLRGAAPVCCALLSRFWPQGAATAQKPGCKRRVGGISGLNTLDHSILITGCCLGSSRMSGTPLAFCTRSSGLPWRAKDARNSVPLRWRCKLNVRRQPCSWSMRPCSGR